MKRLYRYKLIVLAVAAAIVLCGCVGPSVRPSPASVSAGQIADDPITAEPPASSDSAVPAAVSGGEKVNADKVGVRAAFYDNFSFENSTLTYAVPEICGIDGDEIKALNDYIFEAYYNGAYESQVLDSIYKFDSPEWSQIIYHWYINGDILSVVIQKDHYMYYASEYEVFNVDIKEGRQMPDDELAERCGLDYGQFLEMASDAMGNFYCEGFDDPEYMYENYHDEFEDGLWRTVNYENVGLCRPYLDSDGDIVIVCNIASLAGADYYMQRVPLEYVGSGYYNGYAFG